MAITTELVGKLGGGLSWTKVSGTQKSLAWNASNLVVTSATLGTSKQYLLAIKYTYTSGNPANCAFQIGTTGSGSWTVAGPSTITTGSRQYSLMVSMPLTTTGTVEIRFSPGYQSGTHVLAADLYYAEVPTL